MVTSFSLKKLRKLKKSNKNGTSKLKSTPSVRGIPITLTELETGKSAKVRELHGNLILAGRLKAMGILPDTIIIKKSAIPAEGPIVIQKGSLQFAIGYDMASNIVVEPM